MNVTDGKIKTVVSSFHSFSVSQESETFQLQTAGAESTAPFSLNSVVALAATISISKMKRTSLKDSKGLERRACLFREGKWSGAGAVMTVKHWRVDRSFDRCLLNKVTFNPLSVCLHLDLTDRRRDQCWGEGSLDESCALLLLLLLLPFLLLFGCCGVDDLNAKSVLFAFAL